MKNKGKIIGIVDKTGVQPMSSSPKAIGAPATWANEPFNVFPARLFFSFNQKSHPKAALKRGEYESRTRDLLHAMLY